MNMQCINKYKRLVLGQTHLPPKCGHCHACRMNKAIEWNFRIHWEDKEHQISQFITLTYNNQNVPIRIGKKGPVLTLFPDDYQRFLHRVRKLAERKYKWKDKIRYFLVGEYGKKYKRPHYHIILWDSPLSEKDLNNCWDNKGLIHVGTVTGESISYVSGYTWKRQDEYVRKSGAHPEFMRMSKGRNKGEGIGINYLKSNAILHIDNETDNVQYKGYTIKLPRYFKDRLWSQYNTQLKHLCENGLVGKDFYTIEDLIQKSFIEDQIKSRIRAKNEKENYSKYIKQIEHIASNKLKRSVKFNELKLKDFIEAEKELISSKKQTMDTNKKKKSLISNKLD